MAGPCPAGSGTRSAIVAASERHLPRAVQPLSQFWSPAASSRYHPRQSEPLYSLQDRPEQLPGHRQLRHLEDHLPGVAHDLLREQSEQSGKFRTLLGVPFPRTLQNLNKASGITLQVTAQGFDKQCWSKPLEPGLKLRGIAGKLPVRGTPLPILAPVPVPAILLRYCHSQRVRPGRFRHRHPHRNFQRLTTQHPVSQSAEISPARLREGKCSFAGRLGSGTTYPVLPSQSMADHYCVYSP